MRLDGKVALVTDVDSAIGAAIARRFVSEGASVVGCPAGGSQRTGPAAVPASMVADVVRLEGNVCLPDDAHRIVDAVAERFGRLDVLVQDGAGGRLVGTVHDVTQEPFREAMAGDVRRERLVARTRDRPSPILTRSQIVLEMAYEVIRDPSWAHKQTRISFREPGGDKPWAACFFGSDAPAAIEEVARGDVQVAIVNPAEPLALAARGRGPVTEPVPLRIITIIPSADQMAFVVRAGLGIHSFEELRDRRIALRYSMRDRPDHATRLFVQEVFNALDFTMEDVMSWGGGLREQPGFPSDV
ncbi:MAG: SDR family oxidoreductase, partial [Chloroflexi bacterium]|nr:SDR family oxidoreductase [Chloroflexota bacterium]